jgi:hypothetical protein
MIKLFGGFEKERIINIDNYQSYISLIECIKCKKISFPPCECSSCKKCICQNCNEKKKLICPICEKNLLFFPDELKEIYKNFIIKCNNCNEDLHINQLREHEKYCTGSYDIIDIQGDIKKPLNNLLIESFEEINIKDILLDKDKEIKDLKNRVLTLEKLVKNLYIEIDKLKKEINK